MGTCYHAWLRDEFGWGYAKFGGRKEVDRQVKVVIPNAKRVASFGNWLVYDTDKTHPTVLFGKVLCDDLLFTGDCGSQDLPAQITRPLTFERPKENPDETEETHAGRS